MNIIQGEALAWMQANPAAPHTSVVTSLPDLSELPLDLAGWRSWFVDAVRAVLRWVPADGVAIFYQSDILHRGAWIDKGYLVMKGAEEEGQPIVWHKIVCRKPPGTLGLGRPGFSHMICISRASLPPAASPEVLPSAGEMSWSKAMGEEACRVACRYLEQATATRIVVDPFCGRGSVLRVAETMGFEAVGVDLSAKRVKVARRQS